MTVLPSQEALRHLEQAASLAPSVHNTQPWRLVETPGGLDFLADGTRRLKVLDPDGRQMYVSCGAAVFHARAAARAMGLDATVRLLPDPRQENLVASLTVSPGPPGTEDEISLATAILHRHTFRGAFDTRQVPAALVARLVAEGAREGAALHQVSRPDDLLQLEVLLSRADIALQRDEAYQAELAHWVHRDAAHADGLAGADLASSPGSSLRQRDFTLSHSSAVDGTAPVAEHPTVLVLATQADDRRSWLQAGEALAAVLLRAADSGVQGQPLGQVTDVLAYRYALKGALNLLDVPQLVLRMGFTAALPAGSTRVSVRRDVAELLRPVAG